MFSSKPKAADIIITATVLAAALAVFLCGLIPRGEGAYVVIETKLDGQAVSYPLASDAEYVVSGGGYTLTVTVKDGCAFVSHSDCPGLDCVTTGSISRPGESVVCVPSGIIVRITAADGKGESDGIAG